MRHVWAKRTHDAQLDEFVDLLPIDEVCLSTPYWDTLYQILFRFADTRLALGVSAIVDAPFYLQRERDAARQVAARHNAHFRAIHTTCSDPDLWRRRVERRFAGLPPETRAADWEAVLARQEIWESWDPQEHCSWTPPSPWSTTCPRRAVTWPTCENHSFPAGTCT